MGLAQITSSGMLAGCHASDHTPISVTIYKHQTRPHDLSFISHGHNKDISVVILFEHNDCNESDCAKLLEVKYGEHHS